LDNRDADHLACIVSSRAPTPSVVIVEELSKPSVKPEESISKAVGADLMVIDESAQYPTYDWMSPIGTYLDNQPPSDDNAEVERITRKSKMYHLIDGVLCQQGANDMMMRCISGEEGSQLLQDIHSGVCRSHLSWCYVIGKAFRHGFYWPTTKDETMEVITKCKDWQIMQILFGLLISPDPL
jgi:hypothetical protein